MFEEIIKFSGKKKGPTSIILAGIHGNEKCGVKAFKEILPKLKIERGSVFFSFGNPRAIKKNIRYTEKDLNRMFINGNIASTQEKKSYEYQRAQFLKKYLDKAEALLDIHASSIPKSKSFAICEKNASNIVPYLPVNLVVSGFDKAEPGGTDYYMNSVGKIGICLECGYIKNLQSIKNAKKNILTFLKIRNHIKGKIMLQNQSYVSIYKKYFTKTENFTLLKSFKNFEIINKNQIIGIDGQQKIKASRKSLILFAHNRKKAGAEAFLLGEKKEGLV